MDKPYIEMALSDGFIESFSPWSAYAGIMYAPNQWETTLQCNVVSHWQGAYTKWSLHMWDTSIVIFSYKYKISLRKCGHVRSYIEYIHIAHFVPVNIW